jgi:inosine-uridine nucleoside N-ribohydrolase
MLVKKKVKLLSVMAGNFAKTEGQPEFNIMMDVPSAQEVVNDWPTPIVFSGSEIGSQMLFPAISIEHDFAYAGLHPVAEAYRTYFIEGMFSVGRKKQWFSIKWPHDHGTFDLTAVLYGIRPDRGYFALSKPGKVTVLADGSSRFDEVEGGTHQYLVLNQEQKARTLEAMVMLASEPPTYDRRTQVKNDQP